jgi:acyl carrier protein
MTAESIQSTVFQLLKTIAPDTEPEKLTPDANIRQTLGIDSFDFLNFIVALDEKLGVKTPEEDYGKISTMKMLTTYLLSKTK